LPFSAAQTQQGFEAAAGASIVAVLRASLVLRVDLRGVARDSGTSHAAGEKQC
jgi:hypothetical protein